MGVRQMDRGRVLGHLRVRQKQTRGGRDPHVDTGAAMADEGVVIAHRVLPLRKGFSHSNKVGNTGPEVRHSKGPSPHQGLTNCWLLRGGEIPRLVQSGLVRTGKGSSGGRGG